MDLNRTRTWMRYVLVVTGYPMLVGCFNATLDAQYATDALNTTASTDITPSSIQKYAVMTYPSPSTFINHTNESAFALGGTCTNPGGKIYAQFPDYPSWSAYKDCSSSGTFGGVLDTTSIPYDSQLRIIVSAVNDDASLGPSSTTVFYKKMCSANDYHAVGSYAAGTGAAGSPYVICTVPQFQFFMNDSSAWVSGKYIILMSDLNLDAIATYPIGNSTTQFTANFDGHGRTLTNYTLSSAADQSLGVFGKVSGGVIKDLNVSSGSVNNTYNNVSTYTGGLIGYMDGGSLLGSTFSGTVSTNGSFAAQDAYIGGLVGYAIPNVSISILNSISSGMVSAVVSNGSTIHAGGAVGAILLGASPIDLTRVSSSMAINTFGASTVNTGGLVGQMTAGSISNSSATGPVTSNDTGSGTFSMGGLVGKAAVTTLSLNQVSSTGPVRSNGQSIGSVYLGGLIGQVSASGGSITRGSSSSLVTLASGNNSSNVMAGGLVGYFTSTVVNPMIFQSAARGSVEILGIPTTTANVGGLVGQLIGGTVSQSVSTTVLSGTIFNGGGLIGHVSASSSSSISNVSDSYAMGAMTSAAATPTLGGLYGALVSASPSYHTTSRCYSTSLIPTGAGTRAGFVGYYTASTATLANNYWDTEATGQATSAGTATNQITGMSTATMRQPSNYLTFVAPDWNLVTPGRNGGYPFLSWEP